MKLLALTTRMLQPFGECNHRPKICFSLSLILPFKLINSCFKKKKNHKSILLLYNKMHEDLQENMHSICIEASSTFFTSNFSNTVFFSCCSFPLFPLFLLKIKAISVWKPQSKYDASFLTRHSCLDPQISYRPHLHIISKQSKVCPY